MKKIVLGNDFSLIIPVSRKVHTSTGDVIQDFNLLPACTDLQVNLVNFNETISLPCNVDVEHTSRLIANVDSSKLNIGNYALEVKGKIYGNAWRSNEYEQIAFVNNNASADEILDGEIIEGELSVEVDHVFIFFNPTTELGNLINQVSEVIGEANTALDTMNKATEGANKVDIDIQESNLEITRRTGEKKTFDLETLRGEQGPQGPTGAQGPKGDPGDTVSISRVTATIDDNVGVPTVTTKVSSDGDGATIDFNFSNLRGLPGPTGPRGFVGPIGPQGETGPIGPIGPPGDTGPKGEKGEKGERGEQGLQGERGEQGLPGNDGAKGDKGDKGDAFKYSDFTEEQLAALKGPKGDKGETGPVGPQGPKGDSGEKGEQGIQGVKGDPFTYDDFTSEEIEGLKKPATDAANELNKYLDIVKLPVVETPASETTLAMDANKVYDITIGESLTITLNAPTDLTVTNEYQGSFDTGATAPTVTFPADVIWAETPSVEANTHYEFNIRYIGGKYYGLVQEWNINT